jgi:hypothetical protein
VKARRLAITPELWVQMLTQARSQRFEVYQNRLPEDAKCVGMEAASSMWGERGVEGSVDRGMVYLWIESAAFQDGDPVDLPPPWLRFVPDPVPEPKVRIVLDQPSQTIVP